MGLWWPPLLATLELRLARLAGVLAPLGRLEFDARRLLDAEAGAFFLDALGLRAEDDGGAGEAARDEDREEGVCERWSFDEGPLLARDFDLADDAEGRFLAGGGLAGLLGVSAWSSCPVSITVSSCSASSAANALADLALRLVERPLLIV